MYDGTIFVGGKIGSFGSDAVEAELTDSDQDWLRRKLKVAEIGENFDVSKMTKVVAGKKLWNYDALEPTEKKEQFKWQRKKMVMESQTDILMVME